MLVVLVVDASDHSAFAKLFRSVQLQPSDKYERCLLLSARYSINIQPSLLPSGLLLDSPIQLIDLLLFSRTSPAIFNIMKLQSAAIISVLISLAAARCFTTGEKGNEYVARQG